METNSHTPDFFSFRRKRLPVILQAEATECGLACIAMVAGFHGHECDLGELRQRFQLSLKGLTLSGLIDIAERLRLSARPLRVELAHLEQLVTPCILHWNFNHFVVLSEIRGNKAVIHDPAVGRRVLKLSDVSGSFTGIALELTPNMQFESKPKPASVPVRKLVGSVQGLKSTALHIFLLAVVLELFTLLSPLFVQFVMDDVLADADWNFLTTLGIAFSIFALLQGAIMGARGLALINLGATLNWAWTTNIFGHLIRLPEEYFQKRFVGDVISRFGAIATIQQTLTSKFVEVVLDGVMAVFTLAMLVLYSATLASITSVAILIYALSRLANFRFLRESTLNQIVAAAKQQTTFLDSIQGARAIRLFNRVAAQSARFASQTSLATAANVRVQQLNLLFSTLNRFVLSLLAVVTIWAGAAEVITGAMSIGMLIAFLAYSAQFGQRAANFIDYVIELRMLRLQADRLADIVCSEPESDTASEISENPVPSISVVDVSYRYGDNEPWIIKNLSLEIRAGESIALTGKSGCGKTTLAKILLGLLEPQEGKVLIGGIELKKLGKRAYREMLGTVMEDEVLFAGSIADNISFFDLDATQSAIESAARKAAIHDEIVASPMGYQALVGDMGSALSAGQRQRVLFARALYRNPQILVLDEATSRLDVENERRLNDAVKRMNVTRISIAHRPETIAAADRLVELVDGTTHSIRDLHQVPA